MLTLNWFLFGMSFENFHYMYGAFFMDINT